MKLHQTSLFAAPTAALCLMAASMPSIAGSGLFVGFSGTQQRIESEAQPEYYHAANAEVWVHAEGYSVGISRDDEARSVKLDDVVFTKIPGAASTGLFANAVTGAAIKEVVFESYPPGENRVPFMIVTLRNAVITSIQHSDEPSRLAGLPVERVSVGYQSICMKTLSEDDESRGGQELERCYDKRSGSAY